MKTLEKKTARGAAVILMLAMILMMVSFVAGSAGRIREYREEHLRAEAQTVCSSVTGAFLRPIAVAETMAEDINLQHYLISAGTDPTSVEAGIKGYLSSLRDGLGYAMMFAVCDRSGAYYTCDGISSYINKNYTGNSAWYGVFLASGKEWDLDVDVEQSTDWALSVFVNQLVRDDDNNIIGVCGTAVEMSQLQSMLEDYERIYGIKIDVTDETGLIQIDTDETQIETGYVSLPELSQISDGEYYYETADGGDRVIVYMEEIDMYLTVTDMQSENADIMQYVCVPAVFAAAGILAAAGVLVYEELKIRKNMKEKAGE